LSSSAARAESGAGSGEAWRRTAELLASLAGAPDFDAAADYLLSQVGESAGASRAFMLLMDEAQDAFVMRRSMALAADMHPPLALDLGDVSHPLVASAMSYIPIMAEEPLTTRKPVPFERWIALPLPQPSFRGSPSAMSPQAVRDALADCPVRLVTAGAVRAGDAPGGVLVVEATPPLEQAIELAELVALAGPVLFRMRRLDESEQLADRLQQERDRLTMMVDSLPDPVVITDAANNFVAQNSRAEHLLSARESDSPGRRRAVELNNLLFTSHIAKAVMSGGQAATRELNLVDPDEGADLLFEVLAHPLGDRVGPEDAFLSVLRDVTDLRRAGHELERQFQRVRQAEQKAYAERDRLNLILENVADPILVTDEKSNIILMNEEAERLFHIDTSTPRGRSQSKAVRGNDTRFTSFISDFAISPATARRERMMLTHPSQARDFPAEVASGKIMNELGQPVAIVSVLHDLTRQVENERLAEALKQLNEELEERIRAATADLEARNRQLEWQTAEVARANRLKSEFLASMSHELRTPINAIIGHTSLLVDRIYGEVSTQQSDALQRIRTAAQHLLALINDILDLAKIEAGKMPLHLEDVTLNEVVMECAQQVEPMLKKKGLEFRSVVAGDTVTIHTDRTKVRQVLYNLLSNAVKFTNHGYVSVRVSRSGEGVTLDVADTGLGIKPDDIDAIWEDFRQVDQSRTREFGGTGLGLSITRKLLERLGGSVAVVSQFGHGTVFSVSLPNEPPPQRADEPFAGITGEHEVNPLQPSGNRQA
jgi:PAS domain S-box-containing protein